MQELVEIEAAEVGGGGTRIGTNGSGDGGNATEPQVMRSFTPAEMQQVSGGGTRLGTAGTGDGNRNGEAGLKATPILF